VSREPAPVPVALVDLLDRLLAGGVVVSGEVVLSIGDVDLVYVSLRGLLTSIRTPDGPPPTGVEDAR
jgi:Gas vesicle protein